MKFVSLFKKREVERGNEEGKSRFFSFFLGVVGMLMLHLSCTYAACCTLCFTCTFIQMFIYIMCPLLGLKIM